MRAAVIEKFNEPWQVRDLPDPRPAPGQVLIKIHASGMCYTDLHAHHGVFPLKPPFVAGHEPAGVIVEVGAGVTDLRVGDRVGVFWNQKGCGRCAACQAGHPGGCPDAQSWMHLGGSNAELMVAWASGCALIPEGASFEAAAPIFCAGYTTMSGLRNADPKPGERVVLSTTNSAKQVSSAFSGLRAGGRFINMGLPDGAIAIDPMVLMFGQRQLRGSSQDERSDLFEALNLVASGKVKPILETYPLARANEARERLESGKVRYRAVLQQG